MRKIAVAIGIAMLWVCPQVWAQSPKLNLIRVANPGALSMPGMPGMPGMPTMTFPNTYNSTVSATSYNPDAGSGSGMLYISYNFTGTTQPSPMASTQALHIPQVRVNVRKNGTVTGSHYVQGYGQSPTSQMNQTITVGIDLFPDGCSLDLFMDGTCLLAEQDDQVYCTIAGAFAFFIKNWEWEFATTVSQVVDGSPGAYFLEPYCAPSSDPPDWFGPFGSDEFGTGYWAATEAMIRWQILGKSFYGVPWKAISPSGPAGQWLPGPPPICTMYDHGCSFVAQICTAKMMPTDDLYQPDAILKRRDA